MSFLKKKEKDTKVVLIFDIGSASVGGALVLVSKGRKPRVVYNIRRSMALQEELDFGRFVMSMKETLLRVSEDVSKNGLAHLTFTKSGDRAIEAAFAVYSSPWFLSQTKILKIKRDKQFVVTQSILDKLIADEEKLLSKSDKGVMSEKAAQGAVTIERKVTDIRLEGYHIPSPIGKKTKQASFTVSMAMIAGGVKASVENVLKDTFHVEDIIHHSFPLVATSAVRDIYSDVADFLFVDVSGEVTDVSVVKDHALSETASYPQGKRTVLRDIAKSLGTTIPDARTQLSLYLDNSMSEDGNRIFEQAISDIKKKWSSGFADTLDSLGARGAVPSKLFLMSDNSVLQLFHRMITDVELSSSSNLAFAFDLEVLHGGALSTNILFRKGSVSDPFIGLEAYFVNKTLNVL